MQRKCARAANDQRSRSATSAWAVSGRLGSGKELWQRCTDAPAPSLGLDTHGGGLLLRLLGDAPACLRHRTGHLGLRALERAAALRRREQAAKRRRGLRRRLLLRLLRLCLWLWLRLWWLWRPRLRGLGDLGRRLRAKRQELLL
ncbi:hypothetical protein [Mumia zhuanghuii]|uniref:hypothetical protein n=1 Tax=Mumia zhuanghuii TaxID=2585211 RepID=UPI0011122F26|nr:hypothetical protein [Mumia zhuanghuii]